MVIPEMNTLMKHVFSQLTTTAILLCILLPGVAQSQGNTQSNAPSKTSVLDGPFKGSNPNLYIQNMKVVDQDATLVTAKDLGKQTVLRVTYDNRSFVQFRPVAIEPMSIGELTFKARWNNEETIENNPSFEAAIGASRLNSVESLPTAVVVFLDVERKPINGSSFVVMLRRDWQNYLMRFQTPAKAAYVQLEVTSGRNQGQLYFASPRLAIKDKTQTSGTVALDFTLEQPNVRGNVFGIRLDDMVRKDAKGAWLVYSGSDAQSSSLEIGPPGKYQATVKTLDTGSTPPIRVLFMNDKDRLTGSAVVSVKDGRLSFELPDKAVAVRFRLGQSLLAGIHIQPAAK